MSSASHPGHASPQPQPQPQPRPLPDATPAPQQDQQDHHAYVSYEQMILRALTDAEHHWPSGSPNAKPFPGAPPKQVFAHMARHYAHLLPNNFKGSATQALKKAVKKGLVVHLYRAYALNHDYAGAVAPGRVKPNVWTNRLKLDHAAGMNNTPRARQKISKRTRRSDQVDPSRSAEHLESTFRPLTPHSPLRLPDPIHFLSSSSAASCTASPMPDSRSGPTSSIASSSAYDNDNDDTDLAAQILMTFTTPPPPPIASAGTDAASTTSRPLRPRPPALPLASTHTAIPSFGIPTPGIDSTSFAAARAPAPAPVDVPGSCVRPPTSPTLYPSAPSSAASTRCSSAVYESGPDADANVDLMCTTSQGVLPRPTPLPMGMNARAAVDIVDSILFPSRPSPAAASAVSELDAAHARATTGYPFAPHPPPPSPAPARARPPQPQAYQHQQQASHPIAWLPVRLGPNGQLILPEGWSFIKPTAAAAAAAAVAVAVAAAPPVPAARVHVNGVGMIDERASSESSYGSGSGAGTPVARWWEAGGGAGERGGVGGRRPGGMGM